LKRKYPFRIGTTSYIIPDEIIPNVRFLGELVDDIELVLFEVDDGQNNLPDQAAIKELCRLANQHNLTYTVHLPLDLRLAGEDGKQHRSLIKAHKVIECTSSLNPWAYVLHLDGREEMEKGGSDWKDGWNEQAEKSLKIVAKLVGDETLLAVENLDHYPPNFWDEVLSRSNASRCIDIGHLWKDHHDPLDFLKKHIQRTRVMHMHGIEGQDHKSLVHIPQQELERVLGLITKANYGGVITLEVFNEEDFSSSMHSLEEVFTRWDIEGIWEKN
jgi:sugar phosphate isomerase/epimerase